MCAVVHDGPNVIRDLFGRHFVPCVLVEVAFVAGQDILQVDRDVVVPVRSGLFVVEADGVTDLVRNDSKLETEQRERKLWEKSDTKLD